MFTEVAGTVMSTSTMRFRQFASVARNVMHRSLATAGVRQSEARIASDAQRYWTDRPAGSWKANSHWRDAPIFAGNDLWHEIGHRHLAMFERGARLVGFSRPWHRVIEWGCGGG